MSDLEIFSYYAVIIQAVTTFVIAVATCIYMRVTTRMFEAGIEPSVSVDLFGDSEKNSLTIHNDAGCTLTNFEVYISVGYLQDNKEYPIRRCIYSRNWSRLSAGATVGTRTSPINTKILTEPENDLPDGVKVNPNDLLVDYSFVRNADRRRYCFNFRVGYLRDSDGRRTYIRIGEPNIVPTLKKVIVQRIDD